MLCGRWSQHAVTLCRELVAYDTGGRGGGGEDAGNARAGERRYAHRVAGGHRAPSRFCRYGIALAQRLAAFADGHAWGWRLGLSADVVRCDGWRRYGSDQTSHRKSQEVWARNWMHLAGVPGAWDAWPWAWPPGLCRRTGVECPWRTCISGLHCAELVVLTAIYASGHISLLAIVC